MKNLETAIPAIPSGFAANETKPEPIAADKKFCKFCGSQIDKDCVVCTNCGKQVEMLQQAPAAMPNVVINNSNNNVNTNTNTINAMGARRLSKWVALLLCFFFGVFGAHKFYEHRFIAGFLYLFTCGLFGFGVLFDLICLLLKPNPYYV